MARAGTHPAPVEAMTLSKEDLAELVKAGAVTDIFKAERAYALLKTIGTNADAINASKKNLGELFGVVQDIAQTEVLIAVARLFDPPSKKYPTRCLRALLDDLDAKAEALPPIVEKWNLAKELTRLAMDPADVARVQSESDVDVTRLIVGFLRERMEQPNIVDAVKRVRTLRDKRIAHNEDAHGINGPTWKAVLELLTFAKEVVGLVGWAYMSTVYMHDGRYFLSSDAERPSRAMRRLLDYLDILEPRRPLRPQQ